MEVLCENVLACFALEQSCLVISRYQVSTGHMEEMEHECAGAGESDEDWYQGESAYWNASQARDQQSQR